MDCENLSASFQSTALCQSNGGLISYSSAFPRPEQVDADLLHLSSHRYENFGPNWKKFVGLRESRRMGCRFRTSVDELRAHLSEVNPIENLRPLAQVGIPVLHILPSRSMMIHRELGGEARLDVFSMS